MWRSDSWATWVSREPQASDQPHAAPAQLLLHSRRPLIQELLLPSTVLLPPSLLLMHLQVWAAPRPGAPPWGPSTPCGSSYRHPGVTESSQPLHPEHSAKPTNRISKPHLFCSHLHLGQMGCSPLYLGSHQLEPPASSHFMGGHRGCSFPHGLGLLSPQEGARAGAGAWVGRGPCSP